MTTFANEIRPFVQTELDAAAAAEAKGEFDTAFLHLERAHVLGQPATSEHVRVHWRMFRFAVRHRLPGEAIGQAWRIVAASLFTAVGVVPEGNTGGANVSGFRRLPVSKDLRTIICTATLAVAASLTMGCTTPANLDLSLAKRSSAGIYQVGLVPPVQPPAINQIHSWKVTLSTPDGQPVPGAKFAVDGGMPQHGHGLPTQPRITRDLGNGSYQLDGMKFSMTGWWEVKLAIQGPAGPDRVTFNTVVNNPPVRQ